MSDSEIIDKILSGEISAFREIVERYSAKVLRLCSGIVGDYQAEDAAQEAFLRAYQNLSRFQGKSAFSTWLYRIAYNHCLDLLQKRKSERAESLEAIIERRGDFLEASSPADFTSAFENRQVVLAVLKGLTPQERGILVLREAEGLSYQELTATLGISMENVKIRLFRARQSFIREAKRKALIK